MIDGLQFRHNNGTAHQDLKPENILVSNKHDANVTDAAELNKNKKDNRIQRKLTDVEESKSFMHQTRTVLATRTKHMQ